MGLALLIIALALVAGAAGALLMLRPSFLPSLLPQIGASLKAAEPKRFSPKKTLFLIGPGVNHPACKLQRRLLKPAIPALIREDVTVIEIYGGDRPRKNGEDIDWLDASLLRHAMNAEDGFYVVYVDADGKTTLRSKAPMVTADILYYAGLDLPAPPRAAKKKSAVLKRLRAA